MEESEENYQEDHALKLSDTLRKMRGAALKLGQVLSIQEDQLIPSHIREAFTNARDFSYKMPDSQLEDLLNKEIGFDWKDTYFVEFDTQPFAAASIGQVHKAIAKVGLQDDQLVFINNEIKDIQSKRIRSISKKIYTRSYKLLLVLTVLLIQYT